MPIRVVGREKCYETYALLDEASTITLIDKDLARKIGARGPPMPLILKGIIAEKCPFGKNTLRSAISVDNLNLSSQTISANFIENLDRSVKEKGIKPYCRPRVEILIGQDNWQLIVTREFIEIQNTELVISRCLLGWVLHGPTSRISSPKHFRTNNATVTCAYDSSAAQRIGERDSSIDDLLRYYFHLESIGVSDRLLGKNEQSRAEKVLEDTCRRVDNAYEIGLLWKNHQPPAVDSFLTAKKRLFALEKRLDRDSHYAQLYYSEMQRFIDLGYAKIAKENSEYPRIWYLPHFGVINNNKPNKIRLVFDAAATTAGVSLNDQLDTGPNLLQSLPGIFIRFRQFAIAVKGDISDMFLRVKVREQDRGAQRFLWRGRDRKNEPRIYQMESLIFGAKSSPCSAIFVKNKNASAYAKSLPQASRSIIRNSYMDDFLSSCTSKMEAIALIHNVVKINTQANFSMHGWASNAHEILPIESRKEKIGKDHEMRLCDSEKERVLGLYWDTQTDEMKFNINLNKIPKEIISRNRKPTKRDVLRVVMSIFDPLGLLAPFTLNSKILMQRIWLSGIQWDQKLRDEECIDWTDWLSNLNLLKEYRIPRCLTPENFEDARAQLHIFCDASLTAFAAAVYLLVETEDGPNHVSLIIAKSRIAPLKPTTIPRLELQAALLGARLLKFIQSELDIKIERRVLWTDSTIVLCWIRAEPRIHQVYVANRLGEISELTRSSEWRWVPSNLNPADHATRFTNHSFINNSQWFSGPQFLRYAEKEWPKEKILSKTEKDEIKKLEIKKAYIFTVKTVETDFSLSLRLLGWQGLLIAARRVRKYFDRWRHKINSWTLIQNKQRNEQYWFRIVQGEYFEQEIKTIRKGEKLPKGSSIAGLTPFIDENQILRANGRATLVPVNEFNNTPIILNGKHIATKKLISEYHRIYHHGSKETVINELRQRYYIVGLRNTLKSIISRCIVCRIRRGQPRNPLMGALPACRVASRQRPFTHCGIDYFGPMNVKIGRRREKRWGVLMTCLTTRAIHLELASSLTSSSAIMAIQRLAARRGMPLVIYSDNGTNFKGASKELKDAIELLNIDEFHGFLLKRNIEWRFNPPDAPHMGGAWERLIRSVKTALKAILNDQAPSEESLYTVMTEVEHSVNSRPLTNVSLDPRDKEALTPNHFLIGSSSGNIRLGKYDARTSCLNKQWKLAQSFADAFWKRWLKEYLPTITSRKKWTEKDEPLEVGDMVLIIDLQAPRNCWNKGEIIRVFPGSDKEIRVVEVHTPRGNFLRPARKLIKLLGKSEVQNH